MTSDRLRTVALVLSIAGIAIIAIAARAMAGSTVGATSLALGLAGGFITLTGIASAFASRLRAAQEGKLVAVAPWRNVARVCWALGTVVVMVATYRSRITGVPTLNHIAEGLAGAFVLMTGILACLNSVLLSGTGSSAKSASANS